MFRVTLLCLSQRKVLSAKSLVALFCDPHVAIREQVIGFGLLHSGLTDYRYVLFFTLIPLSHVSPVLSISQY